MIIQLLHHPVKPNPKKVRVPCTLFVSFTPSLIHLIRPPPYHQFHEFNTKQANGLSGCAWVDSNEFIVVSKDVPTVEAYLLGSSRKPYRLSTAFILHPPFMPMINAVFLGNYILILMKLPNKL